MRCGKPSVADALTGLKQQGCDRILVLPLYPQYAASSTATAMDAVGGGDFHYIPCLNERDGWIHALADIVATNLRGWVDAESAAEELERSRTRMLAAGAKN